MSLANIKLNNSASRGFTIVELLIVVVVIAILAAITIVSYNGITTRANASAAKSTASTLQKKIELYAASEDGNGAYPVSLATLTGGASSKSWAIPSGSVKVAGTLNNGNGKDTLRVVSCGTNAGVQIQYFDFETNAISSPIGIGNTTSCSTTPWND